MCIRKLLFIACCIIVVIAVCCQIRHPRAVMTSPCLETSPRLLDIPIYTYTPTYTVIVDTDGMEHNIINPISIGPSGLSILKDADGHTIIFDKNKFYHGLDRTHCLKCYELSRLPNNN